MEKKNTVLLTVIAVATLLVAVVGATFAYFTASASGTVTGKTEANTPNLATVKLNTQAIQMDEVYDIYPGTMNYVGASADAVVETADGQTKYDYNVNYTVTGTVTLSEAFNFPVEYTLYKVETPVTAVTCGEVNKTDSNNEVQFSRTCDLDAALKAEGAVAKATQTIAADDTELTKTFEINETAATNDGKTYYYYLVVNYPNQTEDQNADQAKKITIKLDVNTVSSAAIQ